MMNKYLILLTIIFCSCQSKKDKVEKITLIAQNEVINRAKLHNLDYSYAVFKGADGPMSKEEHSLLNKGKLARDFYENSDGEIVEVRVRPIQLADKFLEIQIRAAATNPLSGIELIDVDCSNLDTIYEQIHESDQQVRTGGGDMYQTDSLNRQTVISAIFNCGWTEEHLQTIWLIFQHSSADIMAYFYPELKQFSEEGKLSRSSIALLEDRLLMRNGYKQVYGSQIRNGQLFDLEDPDSVNVRRQTMGLGPIEDYILNWNLDWEVEKARMKKEEE